MTKSSPMKKRLLLITNILFLKRQCRLVCPVLKYQMAWHLAEPITDQVSKTDYWKTVALGTPGDNNRGGYMRTAMNIDGQGNTPQMIEDYSLIAVRY